MPQSSTVVSPRIARTVLRLLLLLWAGFWAWFVLAVSLGEPPPPPWWIPVAWLAGLGALVGLCWRWPAAGGLVLIAAGIWAGLTFDNSGARVLLAAPAVGLGLGSLAVGWSARRAASAALLGLGALLSLGLAGCLTPQDPADLPFQTSSIQRYANGNRERALLLEQTQIEGFACEGWIRWYEDGHIESLELARGCHAAGHDFPAGTRLFFDREGWLAHAWLSQDTVIEGHVCRGRWKIDTAFHPNGALKAFFPPDDLELEGLLCQASVFHPVYLHPDGRLQQCTLAADATLDGRTYHRGETVILPQP